jgi:uncharacterized repeat protein (TIGR01451 family)
VTITYERLVGNPLPSPQQQIINVAEVTYGTGVIVSSTNVGAVTPPQFTVTKASDLSSPALPGQVVQYTITINNSTPLTQTGISVLDALPTGTSYVAESTVASSAPPQTVADLVNAQAYGNNDGPGTGRELSRVERRRPGAGDVRVPTREPIGRRRRQHPHAAANLTAFGSATSCEAQ